MQHVVNLLQHAEPQVWYCKVSRNKCNILIVNIIYMVIGLLLYCMKLISRYKCIRCMHMCHLLQVVHFTCNDVCKV